MNTTPATPSIDELNREAVHRLFPTFIYLGLLIITGTIGNIVVIYVYKTQYRSSNTKYFIVVLGVIDLYTCCVVLPLEIATMTMQLTFEHVWLCKVSRFGNSVSTMSSAAMLMFISIDRYRKMCKPFGWQITRKCARVLCVLCMTLGLMVSFPTLFIYGRKTVNVPEFNMTGAECSVDDSMTDTIYPFISSIVMLGVFIIGTCVVVIMYCCIGCALNNHAKRIPDGLRATSKRTMSKEPSVSVVSEEVGCVDMNSKGPRNCHDLSSETVVNGKCNTDKQSTSCEFAEIEMDDEGVEKSKVTKPYHAKGSENLAFTEEISYQIQNGEVAQEYDSSKKQCDMQVSEMTTNLHTSYRKNSSMKSSSMKSLSRGKRSFLKPTSSSKYSKPSSNVRKTSVLMLIISVTFIVSYLPHLLLMLIREAKNDFVDGLSDRAKVAYLFLLRSYFLNCATNPVIYCIYGSHFRAVCKRLLLSLCRHSKGDFENDHDSRHLGSYASSPL